MARVAAEGVGGVMKGANGNIDYLLRIWGRWSVRLDLGGVGFPGRSSMFNLTPPVRAWQSVPLQGPNTQDLELIGRSVERLPPELKIVCVLIYREEKSLRDVGRVVGINLSAAHTRLKKAQARIVEILKEMG